MVNKYFDFNSYNPRLVSFSIFSSYSTNVRGKVRHLALYVEHIVCCYLNSMLIFISRVG